MSTLTKVRLTIATLTLVAMSWMIHVYGWTPVGNSGDGPGYFAPINPVTQPGICRTVDLPGYANGTLAPCPHP